LFYRKQTSFHCKPKPLIANPPLQLRGFEVCNWGFHMFLLLLTTKYFIASRSPWLQAKILNCKPKPLIATPPLQLRIWNQRITCFFCCQPQKASSQAEILNCKPKSLIANQNP
jgi:hypothetical protein